MPRNPPDPETVQLVLDLSATGLSDADVSAELKVNGFTISESQVGKWRRDAGRSRKQASDHVKARAAERREAIAEAIDDAPEASEVDQLAFMRHMQGELMRAAKTASAIGNETAAQRSRKTLVDVGILIARLEKASKDDELLLRFSRQDVERGMAELDDRMRKLLDRPLLCSQCSRELSIEWGHGRSDPNAPPSMK